MDSCCEKKSQLWEGVSPFNWEWLHVISLCCIKHLVASELFRATLFHISFISLIQTASASLLLHCRCKASWPIVSQCFPPHGQTPWQAVFFANGVEFFRAPSRGLTLVIVRADGTRKESATFDTMKPGRQRWVVLGVWFLQFAGRVSMWQDLDPGWVYAQISACESGWSLGIHASRILETGLGLPMIRKQWFHPASWGYCTRNRMASGYHLHISGHCIESAPLTI